MKINKRLSAFGLVSAVVLASAAAVAFPKTVYYSNDATNQAHGGSAGASNIYGTGSTRDWGITCALCHVKAAGLIDATVLANPSFTVMGVKKYTPLALYTITVTLVGEHLNPGDMTMPVPDNLNSFALTAEDQNGATAGVFTTDADGSIAGFKVSSNSAACTAGNSVLPPQPGCPICGWEDQPVNKYNAGTGTTALVGDCHAIINLTIPNRTAWTFKWQAPKMSTGPVTLYYGVVDGNSHGTNSQDDDVKIGTVKLMEGP
jgi:hypothetical protein